MQDRLTRRGFDPELEFCAECDYHGEPNGCNRARGNCSAYDVFTDAYVRLAAYEDTGLTPDEIAALRADRDQWQDGTIIVKLADTEADRDAWRRRAEAAEADLNHIAQEMFSDNSDDLRGAWYPCEVCKKYDGGKDCYDCLAASYDESKPGVAFEWRGPVAENKEGV